MNILLLSKFPPIQGGESNKSFFLAKALAERGHNITVLTNSLELESSFLYRMTQSDYDYLAIPNLTIVSLKDVKLFRFIPYYNPSSEALVSIGLELSAKREFDVIIGWYLLPFCSSAFILSKILGIKYVAQHAGSDIKRLLTSSKLRLYLEVVLKKADGIFTYPSSYQKMKLLNENVYVHRPGIPNIFNPDAEKINLEEELGLKLDGQRTVLFLGKISKAKGISFLIDAFKPLCSEYNLLIVGEGPYKKDIIEKVKSDNVQNVYFHQFIPPWKIPNLIRAIKCVVIPEWNFGVETHRSGIPIETILCGRQALVSNQIVHNYLGLSRFLTQIECPNTLRFTETLRTALCDQQADKFLSDNYESIRSELISFDEFVDTIEKDLTTIINNK